MFLALFLFTRANNTSYRHRSQLIVSSVTFPDLSFPAQSSKVQESIDYERTWPSSYTDYACVGWSKTRISDEGVLEVSFPQVRYLISPVYIQQSKIIDGKIFVEPKAGRHSNTTPSFEGHFL